MPVIKSGHVKEFNVVKAIEALVELPGIPADFAVAVFSEVISHYQERQVLEHPLEELLPHSLEQSQHIEYLLVIGRLAEWRDKAAEGQLSSKKREVGEKRRLPGKARFHDVWSRSVRAAAAVPREKRWLNRRARAKLRAIDRAAEERRNLR